jgi:hypothetical protein
MRDQDERRRDQADQVEIVACDVAGLDALGKPLCAGEAAKPYAGIEGVASAAAPHSCLGHPG